MTCMVDAALRYADTGRPVFPVRPGAKTPLVQRGLNDATTDPDVIRGWWRKWPNANIGMRTGEASRIVVLDVDGDDGAESLRRLEREHGPLPRTASVVTPRGGSHYWFRYPGRPVASSAGKVAPGLDVRADGGYVLVPPSRVLGRAYEPDERAPIAPTPGWLLPLAAPEISDGQIAAAPVDTWLQIVRGLGEGEHGGRDNGLARFVGHLLRRHVDPVLVLHLAHLVNTQNRPPLPQRDVERIVESIAGRELARRRKAVAA